MKLRSSFLWLLLLILAVLSRFLQITNKPIHFDESINGWFAVQLAKTGYYKYDPNNFHGPMYFYLLQFFETLWGRSLATLRTLPAVFSVFSVMIFSFGFLGSRWVNRSMMIFLLLSPAFLFFGRSGIHETPFVFFQLLFALGLLRWGECQDNKALFLFLIGAVGMMLLKETFVLTVASMAVGVLFLGPAQWRKQFSWEQLKMTWSRETTALVIFLSLFFVGFFTGFMRNPVGLVDFFRAFIPWMKTGVADQGHAKEFFYWLKVLGAAEPVVLLGVIMACAGLFVREAPLRMMSAFSLTQLLLYSLIPYKTVWCVLSIVWGFYFVLAMFLDKFFNNFSRLRWILSAGILLLLPLNLRSAYLAVYRQPIAMEHAFVYVNSTYELTRVQDLILTKLHDRPELRQELIQVGLAEQWPWPWIFRNQSGARYESCHKKIHPRALVYFCDAEDASLLESQLQDVYLRLALPLRQGREDSLVYLRKNVFDGSYAGEYEVVGPTGEFK